MSRRRDAIVIGAGHNGLITAAYLARAGLEVVVLERAGILGGAAVTEELWPGFRCDTGAHHIGGLHPALWKDLDLSRHGAELFRPDPTVMTPLPAGGGLVLRRDLAATAKSIELHSPADAGRWEAFAGLVARVASLLETVHATVPPRVPQVSGSDLPDLVRLGARLRGLGRKKMMEALRVLPMTAEELLSEWFETDALKGTIGAVALTGMAQGPMATGTAMMLFHHHVGAEPGVVRPQVRARGGTGALAAALAGTAKAAGVQVRTQAQVERILVGDGAVRGVVLRGGEEVLSDLVVSSADPTSTFLELLDPTDLDSSFVRDVRSIRYRGATAKVHLALGELPKFEGVEESALTGAISISPSLEYLERASDAAKYGAISEEPYLEAVIPTILDPILAPEGRHVMSVLVQYAPYNLSAPGWDASRRAELGDRTVATLARYAPNLPDAILERQVSAPADLEDRFGLREGNIYHGEMTLDRLFFMRPVPGWARYDTPVRGLYLCGAGSHPGGGVTGYAGRNAARRILGRSR
jgi:phytoene dehydrogenase-like protein